MKKAIWANLWPYGFVYRPLSGHVRYKIKTNPMHFLNSTSLPIYHPAIALRASTQKETLELNVEKKTLLGLIKAVLWGFEDDDNYDVVVVVA